MGKKRKADEWTDLVKSNIKFESFYKELNIIPSEQWDEFMDVCRSDLPTSFRITGSRATAYATRDVMKSIFNPSLIADKTITRSDIRDVEIPHDSSETIKSMDEIQPPTPIPFYPDQLGWQYQVSRSQIKSNPIYKKFHEFLVAETEVGNISRQEVVSMIPVLLLDVKPGMNCLDMCAAPGSKTAQIIENVHGSSSDLNSLPNGLVIANELDNKRSYTLVHNVKRIQSPCSIITNHDASLFPRLLVKNNQNHFEALQFDRVLADVPCSGDGTIRKNPLIWRKWNPADANGLHEIQSRILLKSAQITKIGGRIVYSTCSLNPIENEAVVARILKESNGALELVDVKNLLPELKRMDGIKTWKIMSKSGKFYSRKEDLPADMSVKPTIFPLPREEMDSLNIERCLRILPHFQNTGGFFVAVISKVGPMCKDDHLALKRAQAPRENGSDLIETETQDAQVCDTTNIVQEIPELLEAKSSNHVDKKLKFAPSFKEAPFIFVPETDMHIKVFKDEYKVSDCFPFDQFLIRCEKSNHPVLYFVTSQVKKVLTAKNHETLKVVNSGIRAFTRDGPNVLQPGERFSIRFYHEMLPFLSPQLISSERLVNVTLEDMMVLLTSSYPRFSEFSRPLCEILTKFRVGGCIFMTKLIHENGNVNSSTQMLSLSVWRAATSVNLMLNTQEHQSLLTRLIGGIEAKNVITRLGANRISEAAIIGN